MRTYEDHFIWSNSYRGTWKEKPLLMRLLSNSYFILILCILTDVLLLSLSVQFILQSLASFRTKEPNRWCSAKCIDALIECCFRRSLRAFFFHVYLNLQRIPILYVLRIFLHWVWPCWSKLKPWMRFDIFLGNEVLLGINYPKFFSKRGNQVILDKAVFGLLLGVSLSALGIGA